MPIIITGEFSACWHHYILLNRIPEPKIMADASKLFCIVVRDSGSLGGKQGQSCSDLQDTYHSFRYTSSTLRSTLQLMGCKTRHAFKISKRVFEMIKGKALVDVDKKANSLMDAYQLFSHVQEDCVRGYYIEEGQVREGLYNKRSSSREDSNKVLFGKKRVVAVLKRELFFNIVCDALAEYRYVGPNQRTDLAIACRLRERKESIIILLSGASGCGKSTLSSLLASRLGITTVVSTDSIRHMMRGFVDENKNPLLWASTYHAGECLDPVSVAKAKARKKEKKNTGHVSNEQFSSTMKNKQSNMKEKPGKSLPSETRKEFRDGKFVNDGNDVHSVQDIIGPKTMAIEGYKAQSEMVIDSLDRLITIWEERKESVVIEGVHLSLNFVMGLMKKHPSIIPFMIYIANEEKHLERFAVRAKYMTLDPQKNKYVKYIQNIRTIQEYLCDRAEKHLVPKVNNTNVDKSVASIHATIFSCLHRRDTGEQLYDQGTNTVKTINDEFRNCCSANSVSSKGMFRLIQRKGSSRHLMALVNIDGSVEKAWPIDLVDSDGQHCTNPVYGPLQIGKEEPVHLQFGNFGISCWPHEAVGTSHANFLDSNEQTNNHRSVSSSPKHSDGTAKEPIGGSPVSVSDDEEEETRNSDDDELSDVSIKKDDEDLAGSVEESAGSEDRSEDLASFDEQDDDEWSESFKEGNFEDVRAVSHEREDSRNTLHNTSSLDSESHVPHRYSHNKSTLLFHSVTTDTNEILVRKTKSASSKTRRIRSRSKSLSALEKQR